MLFALPNLTLLTGIVLGNNIGGFMEIKNDQIETSYIYQQTAIKGETVILNSLKNYINIASNKQSILSIGNKIGLEQHLDSKYFNSFYFIYQPSLDYSFNVITKPAKIIKTKKKIKKISSEFVKLKSSVEFPYYYKTLGLADVAKSSGLNKNISFTVGFFLKL